MYELLVRSRWFILAFLGVTLASIVTYVANGPRGESVTASRDAGPPVEITSAAEESETAHAKLKDDGLIDKTVGEDVRPEEEKQAEAAAVAAAAGQAKMQPVLSESGEGEAHADE